MARAGFAGSVIVEAGWKGKRMSKGIRNSQKQVKSFARSIKGLVAMAGIGLGGFTAAKGIMSLVKMSRGSAEAWSDLNKALHKFKMVLAKELEPVIRPILEMLTEMVQALGHMIENARLLGPLLRSAFSPMGNLFSSSVRPGQAGSTLYAGANQMMMGVRIG